MDDATLGGIQKEIECTKDLLSLPLAIASQKPNILNHVNLRVMPQHLRKQH